LTGRTAIADTQAVNSRAYSALAALAALLGYIVTATGGSYWLDGGELVSATIALDILHPPGHPLAMLWGKAFTLLPLGALPFRVALGQAVAAALGIYFLCEALQRTLRALELPDAITGPLAGAGSVVVAFCFGLWFQAVRPEVYALQALTLLLGTERLCALVESDFRDGHALLGAAIATGLGLTNHHLMAFFFFPPLVYGALRLAYHRREHGAASAWRPLWLCAIAGALCLLVYVYLPARSSTALPLNPGAPTTLARIFWVVSARVYARDMGESNPQPLDERYLDVLVVLLEQLGLVTLLLMVVGAYAALRDRRLRALGGMWLLIGASVLLVRPWIGPVRGNPDSMGYLIAGYAAVGALATLGAGALLATWSQATQGAPLARSITVALAAAAMSAQVAAQAPSASLASFASTDAFDDARLRTLPPRSVLIATTPQTVFRYLELQTAERVRPDVTILPIPFLRYPGVVDGVVQRAPELGGLVHAYFTREQLGEHLLTQLSDRRPLFVELDTDHIAPETYAALWPEGPLYRVRDRTMPSAGFEQIARHERKHAALVRALTEAPSAAGDPEVTRALLWMHFMDALYFGGTGQRAAALRAIAAARALAPEDEHAQAFERALMASAGTGAGAGGTGVLDVRPFLRLR
jgi:hypothetical protein